ncbi:hypothetical protein ACIQUM_36680 [Amycolatopsis azurea]|uniref:Uncharacterized protein n=1 Tax=Amycolatopsis azurea DSM 43854 TaxID=1238180 RepID=M2QD14_9PSEU|nr:hypothetical protein [Amycolatopsis azurea]EMD23962.1 hypothetical protein C791_6621 [Amycolatopsis azurea DSM 43854]OOC04420.1 hypothetical protein B0293_21590 [Amycolatopsis azurea DSM 43854]
MAIGPVALYTVVAVAPSVLFWCALKVPAVLRWWRRRREPEVPVGPPIEKLAADLRRVHRLLADLPSGASAVRRNGTKQAYDALLVQACREVEVDHRLDELPEGFDRGIERLRVEESLAERGLSVS